MTNDAPIFAGDIAAGLHAAQKAAIPVGKDATHTHHKYKYVSADSMIAEGRAALREGGLALFPAGWRFESAPDEGGSVIGRVVVRYVLSHVGGAWCAWESSAFVIVEKGRPADKAELGALTENLAYTLRGLLLLPRVDEQTAIELRDDRNYDPAAKAPEAAPRPAPPAQHAPANDAQGDPAHGALAAEFKRRLKDVAEWEQLGDLNGEIEAAKLPPADLLEVRAEVACVGLAFAAEQDDLDFWAEKLKAWGVPDPSPERERIGVAFDAADQRVERANIQGAA